VVTKADLTAFVLQIYIIIGHHMNDFSVTIYP